VGFKETGTKTEHFLQMVKRGGASMRQRKIMSVSNWKTGKCILADPKILTCK